MSFIGNTTSLKNRRRDETPPPEANGHVPHGSTSQIKTESNGRISEPTNDSQPQTVDENVNNSLNGLTLSEEKTTENKERTEQELQLNEDDSLAEVADNQQETTSGGYSFLDRVPDGEEQPVITISSELTGREVVSTATGGDKETDVPQEKDTVEAHDVSFANEGGIKETIKISNAQQSVASKTSLSGKEDAVTDRVDVEGTSSYKKVSDVSLSSEVKTGAVSTDEGNISNEETAPQSNDSEVNLADKETYAPRATSEGSVSVHRNNSQARLAEERDAASDSDTNAVPASQKDTSQITLSSDKGTIPGHDETARKGNSSRQSLGFSNQNNSPSANEAAQPSEQRETTQDPTSPGEKEVSAEQNVDASTSYSPSSTPKDATVSDENNQVRICSVTANVRIGSLEDPEAQKTVTLSGSVYRTPRKGGDSATPKPGEKIGFVKGEVTSIPVDNQTSEKLATLSGDLFAVAEEGLSKGLIATASIDVLSCLSGEKIATITADVAPSDDPDHQTGVIMGDVLTGTDTESHEEKIGSLSGKVVALTFDEDILSIASGED